MIQAIDRAAKILDLLQGARHLGITDLAAALSLPPSTVHGLVKSLRAHGLVAKERGGQRYMLGPTLLRLSNVYLDTLDVRARAMRWTQELARRTELSVRLGAPHLTDVLVIHHNLRPDDSPQMLETGMAVPAHASAMGKVLLAYDQGFQQSVFAEPLRSLTGDTITDVARLTLELPGIAERGTAAETDEAVLGESSSPPRSPTPRTRSSPPSPSCCRRRRHPHPTRPCTRCGTRHGTSPANSARRPGRHPWPRRGLTASVRGPVLSRAGRARTAARPWLRPAAPRAPRPSGSSDCR